MRPSWLLAALAGDVALAAPSLVSRQAAPASTNPFDGKKLFANPAWATKLETTYKAFIDAGDTVNAAKVRTVQKIGTFVWVSDRAGLRNIDAAITAARAEQTASGQKQIVGLVLYNLPDRDCSAGESAGELSSDKDGLKIYKEQFIAPYAEKLAAAKDLTFAVVVEPDSLGNVITNQNIPFCKNASVIYEEGIGYAIAKLQFENVHLYIDAAHGGWLGWNDNLAPTAAEFAKVVAIARNVTGSNSTSVRGFATNVSNYNPWISDSAFNLTSNATTTWYGSREDYTEWSNAYNEGEYAKVLSVELEKVGLPTHFIIDQGRVAPKGARKEWGEWCNVPAGFGPIPGSSVGNYSAVVDSLVWIKPGGESDGQCGMTGAPRAGAWFDAYVQQLVKNAHPDIKPAA